MSVAIEASVEIDGQISKLLRKFPSAFPELMDLLGGEIASQTRRRIQEERAGPDGAAWAPWSKRYAKRREGEGGDLLFREGDLDESIQHFVRGSDEVVVGSPMVYAATHQFGDPGRGIPARPFLGISRYDGLDLVAIIDAWRDEVLREASREASSG